MDQSHMVQILSHVKHVLTAEETYAWVVVLLIPLKWILDTAAQPQV
jgi:hypothetical protein